MRLFKGFVVAACAAFLMACGGGSPADKMLGHADKIISLLESNKGDLDKAAKEVQAYFDANKATMESEKQEIQKWAAEQMEKFKDNPEGAMKFAEEMQKKGEGIQARMEALEKEVPGIKEHEGLKKAMEGMGAMFGGM
ncbi:MAG TPA: hypothetical protein PK095_19010 [Myxococcota bacterium]|nr:hypothetical protein [Myxococcota bacterium]